MSNPALSTHSRRRFLFGSAAAGIAASLAACAPEGTGSGSSGNGGGEANPDGTIKAAISYELGTNGYDPMSTTSALTIAVNWHTMEGLTELDPVAREPYPALAAELPESTESRVEVAIRDDAMFHNGEPVTAEDVVYSFNRVLDPDNASLYASFIPFIDSVEAVDDQTVAFNLSTPSALLAERLSVVKIVPQAAVEDMGADAFDANPVGSGPWKMTDNGASGSTIIMERNDDYNGPVPAQAAKMEWQIIADASTRTSALQSNSVQAIDSVPYLSIEQLESNHDVESVPGFGLLFAMFNNSSENPFNDLRNRQAFMYAIDMDSVIQNGLSGQAEAATCFVQKDHPNYREASTVYTQDADRARELFQETGLTSMRLLVTDHDWVQQVTPIIQESLTSLGIDVAFDQRQRADVYNTIDGNPDAYDVVVAPGDPSVFGNDPDLLMSWWYAADTWTEQRMHWKGSESYDQVQDLLGESLSATDSEAQEATWVELFNLISEQIPLYPLFHRHVPTAWSGNTLTDFEPISLTGLSFIDVGTTED